MEQLWLKKSNAEGAIYVDIFKKFIKDNSKEYNELIEEMEYRKGHGFLSRRKCNELSTDFRREGNEKFADQKWLDAMDLYNESLCFGIRSENVSIAYANRSACFFQLKMYETCIFDIDLAMKSIYPECLMPKLLKRKADCLKLIETTEKYKEFEPKLSFEANENFPGMANVLQIECNPQFGRHITAKCDIDVGKTVLIEEAFVSAMFANGSKSCCTCYKTTVNLIACHKCSSVMYCSNSACMENNYFHRMECDYGPVENMDYTPYIIRSILIAINTFPTIEDLMDFVEAALKKESSDGEVPHTVSDAKSKYRSFLKLNVLLRKEREIMFVSVVYKAYIKLLSDASMKKKFKKRREKNFLMHLIGQHYCVLICNSFYFKAHLASIFNIKSYFNHSCSPNVIRYTYRNQSVCTTSRPIKMGDQLFLSYVDETEPRKTRQQHIYEEFGFRCKCENCEHRNRPNDSIRIQRDACYKYLADEFDDVDLSTLFEDKSKVAGLTVICIAFLCKYGNLPWNAEIQFIADRFDKLLKIQAEYRF